MTVNELIKSLEEIKFDGMGERDVVFPSLTGGDYLITDIDANENEAIVRLS